MVSIVALAYVCRVCGNNDNCLMGQNWQFFGWIKHIINKSEIYNLGMKCDEM